MPTVIDSLIVEIGLDPTKFTSGQKAAIKSFNDAKEAAVKTGGAIEETGKRSAEYLSVLSSKLLGLTALFATGLGIDKFVSNITKQDFATGKLAYTLETTTGNLDKWRNAAYLAGGSSEGITNFIQGLTSEFQKFAITGESNLIPYFRGLGVQIADATGKMRPFQDIIRDVSNAVAKLGPAQGAEWLRSIGADQGSINLIIKGGDELDRYLKLGAQFSTVNAQNTENATKLTEAYRELELAATGAGRAVLNYFSKPLIDMAQSGTSTFQELSRGEFISKGSFLDHMLHPDTPFRGFGTSNYKSNGESSGGSSFPSKEERVAFYRAEAAKRGISPDVIEQLVRSEGLNGYVGDRKSSFGDFQLHYGGVAGGGMAVGGLGDTFTKKTGLDARNPDTWKEQALFSLDQIKTGGLSPWHGWKGSPWAGIDRSGGGGSSVSIGNVNIHTQATDAPGIAATIKPAIEKSSLSYQGQAGPQ